MRFYAHVLVSMLLAQLLRRHAHTASPRSHLLLLHLRRLGCMAAAFLDDGLRLHLAKHQLLQEPAACRGSEPRSNTFSENGAEER